MRANALSPLLAQDPFHSHGRSRESGIYGVHPNTTGALRHTSSSPDLLDHICNFRFLILVKLSDLCYKEVYLVKFNQE